MPRRHYDEHAQRAGLPIRSRWPWFAEAERAALVARFGEPQTDREEAFLDVAVMRSVEAAGWREVAQGRSRKAAA
jgi:hypothetical protein